MVVVNRPIRAAVVALLAVILIGMADGPADAGKRKPKHAFKIGAAHGPRFDGFGVDIKRFFVKTAARSLTEPQVKASAVEYVRVPFTAMTYTDDHHFNGWKYRRLVEQMREIRQRRPRIKFYLNRKNYTRCPRGSVRCLDFPRWMKNDRGVLVPGRYGRYMGEAYNYFRSQGIRIRFFGPVNEPSHNEGGLEYPRRFNRALVAMRHTCGCRPVIGGTDHIINPYGFMRRAHIQRATIHSSVRKFGWQQRRLIEASNAARRTRKPLWNTEFHWNSWSRSFMVRSLKSLPQMLWQQCRGVRMVSFWNMRDPAFRREVMRATANSRCRHTRSYMRGVTVYANDRNRIWVINPTRRTYGNRRVDHNRFRFTRWRGNARPWRSTGRRNLRIPARSITLIRR